MIVDEFVFRYCWCTVLGYDALLPSSIEKLLGKILISVIDAILCHDGSNSSDTITAGRGPTRHRIIQSDT